MVDGVDFHSRTLNALRPFAAEYDKVNGIFEDDTGGGGGGGGGLRSLYEPSSTRSVEYLERHGRCIDTIVPGKSTLPQAGRGAFAKRPFVKDQVVTG